MKRYCDHCRTYSDEAALFCPSCGQYTKLLEIDRIAPEGDIIYPLAHYELSFKDTFLYVMGKKFIDTDGRASRGEFLRFFIIWLCIVFGILAVFYGMTAVFQTGSSLILLGWMAILFIGGPTFIALVALSVRRLHDIGRTGSILLLGLIPLVGPFIVFAILCKRGDAADNIHGEALRHIVIDERLASIMKVSPTSKPLITKILICLVACFITIYGVALQRMTPDNEMFPDGWFTNSIVGEGSTQKAEAAIQGYFDAANQKDYDKAITYLSAAHRNNPAERAKLVDSIKAVGNVVVGSMHTTGISRSGDYKKIVYSVDLQITEPGKGLIDVTHVERYITVIEENGDWKIEGVSKENPIDKDK